MKEVAPSSVKDLEEEHQRLKDEVNQLSRRAYLTPEEQRQAANLKKQKLATKDRIQALKRDL